MEFRILSGDQITMTKQHIEAIAQFLGENNGVPSIAQWCHFLGTLNPAFDATKFRLAVEKARKVGHIYG
jgi:hypothetical protein